MAYYKRLAGTATAVQVAVRDTSGDIVYAAKATVPTSIRTTYDAQYPVTYAFQIPSGSSGLTAEYKTSEAGDWTALSTPSGRFDGVTAARFDYPAYRAYLSVPFAADSDDVWLRVLDGGGTQVGTFIGFPRYYDNRQTVVVCTYDDWANNTHTEYLAAAEAHRVNGLWFSPGINAEHSGRGTLTSGQWADMDAAIAAGHLEPVNHSLTHQNGGTWGTAGTGTAQEDGDREVGTGELRIVENITMPPQSGKVLSWIRPNGASVAELRSTLDSFGYLADRGTNEPSASPDLGFVQADGLFTVNDVTDKQAIAPIDAAAAVTAADEVIAEFDAARPLGAPFMFYSYAHYWPSWAEGSDARRWVEHIGGHDDIWAAGYGHCYLYRLLAQTVQIEGLPWVVGTAQSTLTDSCPIPAGDVGDLLLLHQAHNATSGTAPEGWTLLHTTGATWNRDSIYYRVADGSEGATVTFTGASTTYTGFSITRYRGVDTADPIGEWDVQVDLTSGTTATAPTVTPGGAGRVVRVFNVAAGGTVWTPTASVPVIDHAAVISTLASRPSFRVADQAVQSGGSVPALTATCQAAANVRIGWTILLNAA